MGQVWQAFEMALSRASIIGLMILLFIGGSLHAQDPYIGLKISQGNSMLQVKDEGFLIRILDSQGSPVLSNTESRDPEYPFAFLHLNPKMEEIYTLEIEKSGEKMLVFLDLFFVGTKFLELEVDFEAGNHCFRLLDLPVEARKEPIPVNPHFQRKCACRKVIRSLSKTH